MMSSVRAKDGKAEIRLRKELHARGYRYRLHSKKLMGKPDIVFSRKKIVIFVDGDFWHGRALIEEGVQGLKKGLRTERADWWITKIKKTVQRDTYVTSELETAGWRVVRVWESDVLTDIGSALSRILKTLG
jgi:DNA mismatch endonuclease (patch repair protein)